jgi:hypothetical protein
MSDELLPCPFCGDAPEIINFSVHCNNAYCEAQPFTAGQFITEAIDAWNRRTAPHPANAATCRVPLQWFHVDDERPTIPPENDDDIDVWAWDGKTVAEDTYGGIYEQPAGPTVGGWVCVGHGFAGDGYTRQATHWAFRTRPAPPHGIVAQARGSDEATGQIKNGGPNA